MHLPTREEAGFSLIETLAAITVFALITVGMTPLIVSSLRGTSLARAQTSAKNVVSEAMERIRGLPFYDASIERDVLDFYFPNLSTGYSAGRFTTVCTSTSHSPAASGVLACPPDHADGTSRIPPGYTVTFVARFVSPTGTTSETFNTVTPPSTYNSNAEATSVPPSQLLEMSITASWTQLGRPRTVSLSSLVGDRKLSPDKARASAVADHVFRVESAYVGATGEVSGLSGTGGRLSSDIEIRAVSSASLDASAGQLVLTREETSTQAGAELDRSIGAQAGLRAPPSTTASIVTAPSDFIVHPGLLNTQVGFIDTTSVNDTAVPAAGVTVSDGLPKAVTNFSYSSGVGEQFWMTNQADAGSSTVKKFDPFAHMFQASRATGNVRISGYTIAEATAEVPSSLRKVESLVHVQAPRFTVLPTTFASGTGGGSGIVYITGFDADITCRSTGTAASAVATGDWEATLNYWRDSNPADNLPAGGYVPVTLKGNVTPTTGFTTDKLQAIKTENPLVYDGLTPISDVYLFEDALHPNGYLEDWSSTFDMDSSKDAESSSVSMPYAISILTARTNTAYEQTKFAVEIGKISCQAADRRA